jgi:PPOX class probable F420-dependent enzyme
VSEKSHQDLLSDEKKAFAFLGTLMEDGSPQVTPVWFNVEDPYILINSARGRVKDLNMRARPEVAICIIDPDNPYRYVQFRGRVTEITEEGADQHIDALAYKYLGKEKYPFRSESEVRVTYKILPESIDLKD